MLKTEYIEKYEKLCDLFLSFFIQMLEAGSDS